MKSCELVTSITAISCAIANCVPKEELPLLAAFFSQLSATLATISVQEEAAAKAKEKMPEDTIIPPMVDTTPISEIAEPSL